MNEANFYLMITVAIWCAPMITERQSWIFPDGPLTRTDLEHSEKGIYHRNRGGGSSSAMSIARIGHRTVTSPADNSILQARHARWQGWWTFDRCLPASCYLETRVARQECRWIFDWGSISSAMRKCLSPPADSDKMEDTFSTHTKKKSSIRLDRRRRR